ncbi:DUF4271 domain-containing protein [Flavobacteriales bacterium]|nr:DUF4271 domain-containing protein [Flavobacteriales bacterium]
MFLLERILNEQLFLLIIIAIATILISYCIKNRPILLRSVTLAHLKKTELKFVSNNTKDQIVNILFWTSMALQITALYLLLEEKNKFSVFIIILFISLIVVKRATIFISEIIFQTKRLLETYYTSFVVMVIHVGWISLPFSLYKIIYHKTASIYLIQTLNLGLLSIVSLYLTIRLLILINTAKKEAVSFLHIIFYLCTLEILPAILIFSYLIS